MAIDEVDSIRKARVIYFIWYTLFSAAALAVGLYSRVLLPDLGKGLTGAALDRLTHRCHILETKGESYRLKEAKRRRGGR